MEEYFILVFRSKKTDKVMRFGLYDTIQDATMYIRDFERAGYTFLEIEKMEEKEDFYTRHKKEKYEKAINLMYEGYSKKEAADALGLRTGSITHYLNKTGRQTTR